MDTYESTLRLEAFSFGMAVNAAMSEKPGPALARILDPPQPLDIESLHPMIRGSIGKQNGHT